MAYHELLNMNDEVITEISLGRRRVGENVTVQFKIRLLSTESEVRVEATSGDEDVEMYLSDDGEDFYTSVSYSSWAADEVKTFWMNVVFGQFMESKDLIGKIQISGLISEVVVT